MRRLYIGLLMLLLFCADLSAQDAIIHDTLREVVLYASNCKIVVNTPNIGIRDGLKHESNLLNALNYNSPFYIHTAGPGMLTTAQLDGNRASLTPILWKGINIQSATNGSADLSLISMNMFNQMEYSRSGSGTYNSGVVGGAILLDNLYYNNDREWGVEYSSMNNAKLHTRQRWSDDDISVDVKAEFQLNNNSYSYIKDRGQYKLDHLTTRQAEAKGYQWNVLSDFSAKMGNSTWMNASLWLQKSMRNIPSSKVAANSHAVQVDENKRVQLSFRSYKNKWLDKLQIAYLNEYLTYESDIVDISSSIVHSFIFNKKIRSNKAILKPFRFRIAYRNDRAITSFYDVTKNRSDASAYIAYIKRIQKWNVYLTSRLNVLDWKTPVINGSATISNSLWKDLKMEISVLRNHKFPNLNDLYWPVLGDPNLKRELGHVIHFNTKYKHYLRDFSISTKVNFHFSTLKDKILWSPVSGIWRPSNIAGVNIYGMSAFVKVKLLQSYQFGIHTSFNFAYNKSIITNSSDKNAIGKQLTFAPLYKTSNILRFKLNDFGLQLETVYVGDRFSSSDNKRIVEGYLLQNVVLQQSVNWGDNKLHFSLGAKNLWNKDYDIVPYFAQPLRNYFLRIKWVY